MDRNRHMRSVFKLHYGKRHRGACWKIYDNNNNNNNNNAQRRRHGPQRQHCRHHHQQQQQQLSIERCASELHAWRAYYRTKHSLGVKPTRKSKTRLNYLGRRSHALELGCDDLFKYGLNCKADSWNWLLPCVFFRDRSTTSSNLAGTAAPRA